MKPPRDWDEDYLLNLPDFEPMRMDFKARKGLDLTLSDVNVDHVKLQLSVALSAFANTGGGLIVYGVKDPQPGKPLVIDDGGVDLVMKGRSTKEWLEDVIPTLTDYPLTSFEVHPIQGENEDSAISSGRAVFIVEVGDSERAPHQARDNKYYIRAGSKSVPIPHRIVMDIAGRRQYPLMNINLLMQSNLDASEEDEWQTFGPVKEFSHRQVELTIEMQNTGRVFAQYVNCTLYLPLKMVAIQQLSNQSKLIKLSDGRDYYKFSTENALVSTTGAKDYLVILPQLTLGQVQRGLFKNFRQFETKLDEIRWEVFADNAPMREGVIKVNDIAIFSHNHIRVRPV